MKTKEKEFTPDVVESHLDTIDDLLRLIDYCYTLDKDLSEKLDELKHYTSKLKRFVSKQ